jgi:hypothetical protein
MWRPTEGIGVLPKIDPAGRTDAPVQRRASPNHNRHEVIGPYLAIAHLCAPCEFGG